MPLIIVVFQGYFLFNPFIQPLFAEFVVVELLNVRNESFESWSVHRINNQIISPLLIFCDIRYFSRFDKFFITTQNSFVEMFKNGLPFDESDQTDLGSPAFYQIK